MAVQAMKSPCVTYTVLVRKCRRVCWRNWRHNVDAELALILCQGAAVRNGVGMKEIAQKVWLRCWLGACHAGSHWNIPGCDELDGHLLLRTQVNVISVHERSPGVRTSGTSIPCIAWIQVLNLCCISYQG